MHKLVVFTLVKNILPAVTVWPHPHPWRRCYWPADRVDLARILPRSSLPKLTKGGTGSSAIRSAGQARAQLERLDGSSGWAQQC